MESDASKTATRTKSCLESIKSHKGNRARVIFLFGKAYAGKSSLAEHITGVTGLRGSSETGTERCQIISTSINGTEYFIVDTPGFEDENSQWKIFCDIADILDQIRGHAVVSGVLFVAPVNNFVRRPDVFERRLYTWLAELCGESFSRHLTFVTTFWETNSANQLQKYNDQLQRRRDSEWASFIARGARTYQFGKRYVRGVETDESLTWDTDTEELSAQAKEMVVRHCNEAPRVQPQILQQLNGGTPRDSTTAAKVFLPTGQQSDLWGTFYAATKDLAVKEGPGIIKNIIQWSIGAGTQTHGSFQAMEKLGLDSKSVQDTTKFFNLSSDLESRGHYFTQFGGSGQYTGSAKQNDWLREELWRRFRNDPKLSWRHIVSEAKKLLP